jgi:hypothetical protein
LRFPELAHRKQRVLETGDVTNALDGERVILPVIVEAYDRHVPDGYAPALLPVCDLEFLEARPRVDQILQDISAVCGAA